MNILFCAKLPFHVKEFLDRIKRQAFKAGHVTWPSMYNSAYATIYAVENDQVIGALAFDEYPAPENLTLYVAMIAVLPEMRCRGVTQKLIRSLEEYAQSNGYTAIEMMVSTKNEAMLRVCNRESYVDEYIVHVKRFQNCDGGSSRE